MTPIGKPGERVSHSHLSQRISEAQVRDGQADVLGEHRQMHVGSRRRLLHIAATFEVKQAQYLALRRERQTDAQSG